MQYENVKKLQETIASFVEDLEKINKSTDMKTISALEKRALNKLQLSQVEVEMAGRDLYAAVNARRNEIRRGLNEDD